MSAYLALNHLRKIFFAGGRKGTLTDARDCHVLFLWTFCQKNAFFAIFAHRAPERPQSNLYLKTFMFCKYKGFQEEKNAIFGAVWAEK